MSPKISVVLSVYNEAEGPLRESIESILTQTQSDFEFLIIDDASDQKTASVLESYRANDKIRLLKNSENQGLTKSLNRAIREAHGEWIARQDSDDVSLPNRLKLQLDYLKTHPDVILLGTRFLEFSNQTPEGLEPSVPFLETDEVIKGALTSFNPFCHSSVIFKKELFLKLGGYNETFKYAQDYELWVRMLNHGRGANLNEVLVKRRLTENQISSGHYKKQLSYSLHARLLALKDHPATKETLFHFSKSLIAILLPPLARFALKKILNRRR